MNENTGWGVSVYCFFVAHCPSASSVLIYISIVVGLLQVGVLFKRLRKD